VKNKEVKDGDGLKCDGMLSQRDKFWVNSFNQVMNFLGISLKKEHSYMIILQTDFWFW
jgi:hypothetical protein